MMGPESLRGYIPGSAPVFKPVDSSFTLDRSTPQASIADEPPRVKRAYVKRATNVASGVLPPTSPPQLADLAFNIHGWALEDGMTNRSTFEVINAYNATMIKGGFGAKIRELQSQVNSDVYRHDLNYTARELDVNLAKKDPAVSRYLVIGYTFREDDPIYISNKTFARYSENELVGETRPAEFHVIRWSQCKTPILVVTPVKENTGTSIRLFGLVMPRSGLCQPVLLTHERIFYRWEYRASAGARSNQRNKNWNQVIIDKALSLTRPDDQLPLELPETRQSSEEDFSDVKTEEDEMDYLEMSVRQPSPSAVFELYLDLEATFAPLARVRGITKPTKTSSHNVVTCLRIELKSGEVQGLLHAIRSTRNDRINDEVEAHLHKIRSMGGVFPEDHPALVRFADAGCLDVDTSLAFDVADVVKELWPYLGSMATPDALMRVKHAINCNRQNINNESLENVLRTTLAAIAYNNRITSEALQSRLKEIMYGSQVIQGTAHHPSDTSYHDMPLAIDARFLVMLLKDVLNIHEWQNKAKAHFMQDMPVSYAGQVFEHLIDIKISELTLQDVHGALRWIVKHAQSKSCDADDVLIWLDRLRLRIRQV